MAHDTRAGLRVLNQGHRSDDVARKIYAKERELMEALPQVGFNFSVLSTSKRDARTAVSDAILVFARV